MGLNHSTNENHSKQIAMDLLLIDVPEEIETDRCGTRVCMPSQATRRL
jgi:hypothetical protein